jgi:hypothetical protein
MEKEILKKRKKCPKEQEPAPKKHSKLAYSK